MSRALYESEEAKALPSGLYLGLFHGRDSMDEDMEDWGFQGPMIGPIMAYHVTYDSTHRVGFSSTVAAHEFFPDYGDEWVDLEIVEDCIHYEGKFYGDWTVHLHIQELPKAVIPEEEPLNPQQSHLNNLYEAIAREKGFGMDHNGGAIYYHDGNKFFYCSPGYPQYENHDEPFPDDDNIKIYAETDMEANVSKKLDFYLSYDLENDLLAYLNVIRRFVETLA